MALDEPALGGAAYHLQQAGEKAIKGLLVLSAVPFRRVHDLEELGALAAPMFPAAAPLLGRVAVITVWNTAYRYPSIDEASDPPPPQAVLTDVRLDVLRLLDLLDSRTSDSPA